MRFRASPAKKWFYPPLLCGLVSLGILLARVAAPATWNPKEYAGIAVWFFILAVAFFYVFLHSWVAWGSWVEVDETGVRWKEGAAPEQTLRWEEIRNLTLEGKTIGLMERSSTGARALPFVTRKLYEALKARLRPLPPSEEETLFPR